MPLNRRYIGPQLATISALHRLTSTSAQAVLHAVFDTPALEYRQSFACVASVPPMWIGGAMELAAPIRHFDLRRCGLLWFDGVTSIV